MVDRRSFFTLALAPLRGLAAAVKPVKITGVEIFPIRIPVTRDEAEAGVNNHFMVAEIRTEAGTTGYSFAGPPPSQADAVRRILVGKDLFAVEQHLKNGLLPYGGVEHAVWDAIGRIAGQPVYRLLGGRSTRVKPYITCVWKGNLDQSHVSFREQAEQAVRLQKAGYKGMKIRVWRPNPMDDVEACKEIRRAVGPGFAIMFDRTAHAPREVGQSIWSYRTGLQIALGLQEAGAYWLEEPFAREDYETPAKLAEAVDIPITGGEGYLGIEPFHQCLLHRTYDILQPEGGRSGGILNCRRVAFLAEGYNVPCILHGTMALMLAGWLQATLAIGSEWQEVALVTPPLLPEQQWAPGLKVLNSGKMYEIENGEILAPEFPGIGLDVNPDALQRYRVHG